MKIVNCVQLSPEWWEARRGKPSASNFDRILTPTGQLSKQADAYAAELIADLFCLDPNAMTERPMNAAMRHGVTCEPEARAFLAMEAGSEVELVGGCLSDDGRFWASPDGLIGDDGIAEIKCPQGATHVKYLLEGGLPAEYRPQVMGQLLVTGRAYCMFLSYCAGLPPLVVRVVPDEFTVKLAAALEAFWPRYQALLERVRGTEKVEAV